MILNLLGVKVAVECGGDDGALTTYREDETNCWGVASPNIRVVVAFGPVAIRRYGMDMTLWRGSKSEEAPLREGAVALLCSTPPTTSVSSTPH
ncbi:hypothetical protein Cni_G07227 [Canna indica]|uniref:Uncharacterized protein n=1 Tax=Canna indica TaxID=4628 RepID=A0AAQ3Q6P9_9LILI|nr:hypothetical protein Cni_G07227 [Canna indica]